MSEVLITVVPYDWIMMLQRDASLNTGSLHTAAVDGTIMIFMCFLGGKPTDEGSFFFYLRYVEPSCPQIGRSGRGEAIN